jgi:hypothetical protein
MVDKIQGKDKPKRKPFTRLTPKLSVVEGDKGGEIVHLAKGQGRNVHGLTSKQEAFAVGVGSRGETLAGAYRAAYDASGMAQASIHVEACKLMANPLIAQRVNMLVLEKQSKASLDSTRILAHVRERLMAESLDPDNSPSARIRALELLGRLGTVAAFDRSTETADQSPAHDLAETLQARLKALLGKTG